MGAETSCADPGPRLSGRRGLCCRQGWYSSARVVAVRAWPVRFEPRVDLVGVEPEARRSGARTPTRMPRLCQFRRVSGVTFSHSPASWVVSSGAITAGFSGSHPNANRGTPRRTSADDGTSRPMALEGERRFFRSLRRERSTSTPRSPTAPRSCVARRAQPGRPGETNTSVQHFARFVTRRATTVQGVAWLAKAGFPAGS